MSYAPQTLLDLQALWVSKSGVPLGIVGDTAHQHAGVSYHLGKDALIAGAYSAVLPRDKAGLDNAASAIDLGKLYGSLTGLQAFSRWLVAETRAHPKGIGGYGDIREIIYSPDGVNVKRWDNELRALRDGGDGTGQGDNSHLYHTHISLYRDSEHRDKRPLFARYFELPDTATEASMPTLATYTPGSTITIKPTANVRADAKLGATVLRVVPVTSEVWAIVGSVKGDVDPQGGSDVWYLRWWAGHWEYTAKSNVTSGPTAPVVTDCTAAIATATEPLKAAIADRDATIDKQSASIAALTDELASAAKDERYRLANAEADRLRAL